MHKEAFLKSSYCSCVKIPVACCLTDIFCPDLFEILTISDNCVIILSKKVLNEDKNLIMNNNTLLTDRQTRTIYFDYLRVFAILAVVVLHVSGQNWDKADIHGLDWQIFNLFSSIVRWSVPIFVMISGALFLNRDVPVKKIYSKYVLRLAIAFIVWSVVYALFYDGSIVSRISMLISGHYHMWFILMIIGLYICIPFIKPIAEDEKRTKYYLLLALIFAFVIPTLTALSKDFTGGLVAKGVSAINEDVNFMNMKMVLGYSGYFVLGYYLNKITLTKRQRTIIYVLGMIGFISTILLTSAVTIKTQQYCENYYGNFCINVLLESIAVFTFFKYKNFSAEKLHPIIMKLSKYSFGVYLVHALVIEQLDKWFGLNTLSFNPILSVICIVVIVSVISFSVSAILNQIPIIKKYLV